MKLFLILLFFLLFLPSKASFQYEENLPKELNEVSGATLASNSTSLYVVNDSGNESIIYTLDFKAKIQKQTKIVNAVFIDAEALLLDSCVNNKSQKCLFVGDFGNNLKKKKTFIIYEILEKDIISKSQVLVKKLEFSFPYRSHDIEAFIKNNKNQFIFFSKEIEPDSFFKSSITSKQQSIDTIEKALSLEFGYSHIYRGDVKVNKLTYLGYLNLSKLTESDDWLSMQITDATQDQNKAKLILLTYNKTYALNLFNKDYWKSSLDKNSPFDLNPIDIKQLELDRHYFQQEAVCFLDSKKIAVFNEKNIFDRAKMVIHSLKNY